MAVKTIATQSWIYIQVCRVRPRYIRSRPLLPPPEGSANQSTNPDTASIRPAVSRTPDQKDIYSFSYFTRLTVKFLLSITLIIECQYGGIMEKSWGTNVFFTMVEHHFPRSSFRDWGENQQAEGVSLFRWFVYVAMATL
jgi:hypothetical protein